MENWRCSENASNGIQMLYLWPKYRCTASKLVEKLDDGELDRG